MYPARDTTFFGQSEGANLGVVAWTQKREWSCMLGVPGKAVRAVQPMGIAKSHARHLVADAMQRTLCATSAS